MGCRIIKNIKNLGLSKLNKPVVYIYLPRVGLGNKLIIWAKAVYLAKNLSVPYFVTGWTHFSLGPIFRREKSYRLYYGYFNRNIKEKIYSIIYYIFKKQQVIWNLKNLEVSSKIITFSKVAYISDLPQLSDLRKEIILHFNNMIDSKIFNQVNKKEKPFIGVHIRRGDFYNSPLVTPIVYFISIIEKIREINGSDLPVTIFSDGSKEELQMILKINNCFLSNGENDLVDLLLLSQSQIIVTAKGSSFSYWASFISNAVIIHHPECWVLNSRDEFTNQIHYEGIWNINNSLLIKNIKNISFAQ